MSDLVAKHPFFHNGTTYTAGDPVEPANAADRKHLEDAGLIGSPDEKQAPVPDNKMQAEPDNKAGAASSSRKRKN